MAGVALEMQESPRHNFGQLPPRPLMESIRKSHLLRRSLACSRFLVSCKHDLSHAPLTPSFRAKQIGQDRSMAGGEKKPL